MSGTLHASSGNGFFISGTSLPATISARSAYQPPEITPEVSVLGTNTQTLTLVSDDINATGYSASLPDLTLTLEDTIIAPALGTVSTGTIDFPNVHVGDADSETFSVSNIAAAAAANLDVSLTASGDATATGTVSVLAPGATDATDLSAGITTAAAGLNSGTVTVNLFSDLGDGVSVPAPGQSIKVSGGVYREADPEIVLTHTILHVGDPDRDTLTVTNAAVADAYSENLIASIGSVTGQFSLGSSRQTGEIAAGATDSDALSLDLSTANAGTVAGVIALALISDGGSGTSSIDGLGTTALSPQTINATATIDNYATGQIIELTGTGRLSGTGTAYALDLGGVVLGGTPVAVELGVKNAASSVADMLAGGFVNSGNAAIALSGFTRFSGVAAGQTQSGLDITLSATQVGTFTQQVTLNGTGYNASGYHGTLAPEVLTISGVVVNDATAGAVAPNPVSFGEHHVGDTLSQGLTISNLGTADGYTEALDASIGRTTGAATASGSFSGLAAGATNNGGLTIGLSSTQDGALSGTALIAPGSDGKGIDTLGTTALATQTVTATGTLFNYATASVASPNPVSFGDRHVGEVLSQTLTVSNTGTADGFTEALDASIGNATGAASASGTFSGLAAGAINNGGLTIGLSSAMDGARSGTALIAPGSDGKGIDTLGTTALTTQTVTATGTLFNYATASAASPNPVSFGDRHVGDVLSQTLTVSNTGTADGFTEALDAGIGDATGAVSASGTISGLAAGASNNSSLTIGLGNAQDGARSGTAKITLTSDGAGTDSLGTTALTPRTISATGTLYNYATASAVASNSINFGIVHVGATVRRTLSITNLATSDGFSEALDGSIATAASGIIANGSFNRLAAAATDTTDLDLGLNTTTAGTISGTATVALQSDGSGIDTLGTTPLASQTVAVTGTVNNFATAEIESLSGNGTLTRTGAGYTLALGTIDLDSAAPNIDLGIVNAATGQADLLGGTASVTGSPEFTNTFTAFSGLTAGSVAGGQDISLSTSTAGAFSETITLSATGSNSSGYSGPLTEVLTVTGTVVLPVRTLVWTGANNTNFANPLNWDDTTLSLDPATFAPDPADTVDFDGNGGIIAGTGSAAVLSFGGESSWHLAAGASLTASSSLTVGETQAAVLLISDGVSLTGTGVGGATIADTASAAGSSANVTGGNFLVAGTLVDGNAGAGLLDIGPGGAVSALELDLGSATGGAGVLAIDGPGASLNATNSLVVGAAGVGELSILDGASVTIGGDLDIGVGAGASGNVDIENTTGTTTINGGITLGAGGGVAVLTIGTLTDVVLNGGLFIGKHANLVKHTNFDPPPYLSNAGGVDSYKAYVQNTGAITQDQGGTLVLQTPTVYGAGGSFQINTAGSELQVNADGVSGQVFDFTDNTGTLVIGIDQLTTIDTPSSGTGPFTAEKNPNFGQPLIGGFGGTIAGMVAGDAVVVDTTAAAHISYAGSGTVVSVIDNAAGTQVGTLAFASAALAAGVASGALTVVTDVPCFAAGTRIGTEKGAVAVEDLRVGERVRLAGGGAQAAVWIGSRTIDCARHPRPETVWPVCVARGAFGGNVPGHALYLSPDHAVFVNQVLIPVKLLVNGTSITQAERDRVTYYHVELPEHAVIMAEGLAVESYLDTGDRASFDKGSTIRLFPDFMACFTPEAALAWETRGAAPIVLAGQDLEAARRAVLNFTPDLRTALAISPQEENHRTVTR